MSAPSYWLASVTPVPPPAEANPTMRTLLYAAVVTGSWSGVLSLIVYGIARAAGVPFDVNSPLAPIPPQVSWLLVLLAPLAAAVIGALLSTLLLGRKHARRIVFWFGTLVAIALCIYPIIQPATTLWSTRIVLVSFHVITWFLVVPQLARIVGDSEPGMSMARGTVVEI